MRRQPRISSAESLDFLAWSARLGWQCGRCASRRCGLRGLGPGPLRGPPAMTTRLHLRPGLPSAERLDFLAWPARLGWQRRRACPAKMHAAWDRSREVPRPLRGAICDDHAIASTAGAPKRRASRFSRLVCAAGLALRPRVRENDRRYGIRRGPLPGPPAVIVPMARGGDGLPSAETVNFPRRDCTPGLAARQARPATMKTAWERDGGRCESRLRRPCDCP